MTTWSFAAPASGSVVCPASDSRCASRASASAISSGNQSRCRSARRAFAAASVAWMFATSIVPVGMT